MNCLVLIKFILLLTVSFVAIKADNKACQALADCLQKLSNAEIECEKQSSAGNDTKVPTSHPCQDPNGIALIKGKRNEQRQQFVECLKSRKSEAYDVEFDNRMEECEDVISDLQTSDDNSNSNRTRRDISSGDDETRMLHHGPHRPPPFFRFGDGSRSGSFSGMKHKGKGWHKGKRHHHGHGHGKSSHCFRQLQRRRHQCRVLSHCCTETEICHLKFQVSPLASEIGQMQLDMAIKRHDCKKQNNVPSKPDKGSSDQNEHSLTNSTVLSDDPFPAQEQIQENDEDYTL